MAERDGDKTVVVDQKASKVIMLVEDDSTHSEMLQFVLHSETPHTVLPFDCGSTVFEQLTDITEQKPDLFLFDYKLPGMSGLDLYDRLHTLDDFAQIPTVIITASFSPELEGAITARNLPFIYKPFEIDDLLSLIDRSFV